MTALRLLLWPFSFALSAYRSLQRAEAERERAMLQAVAERLASGVRVVGPTWHYGAWCPFADPLDGRTDRIDDVTCPRCRSMIRDDLLVTPEDIARGTRGGLN